MINRAVRFFFCLNAKKSEKDGVVKKAIDLEQIFEACSEATRLLLLIWGLPL